MNRFITQLPLLLSLFSIMYINSHERNDIIFPSQAMTDSCGGTPNTTFYNVYGEGFNVSAWQLHPSTSMQDPIRTNFSIPKDYKRDGCSVIVEIHLLVNKCDFSGTLANLLVSMDYQRNYTELGQYSPATGFSEVVCTGDFTITPPLTSGNLVHIVIPAKLDSKLAQNNDFAYIAITRIAPTSGEEYNQNIYLAGIAFRYEEK